MNIKQTLKVGYPYNLEYHSRFNVQTLIIDNLSSSGYLYVPSAKRYVMPGQISAIVNIPSSVDIEVLWQFPPNHSGQITDGDIMTVVLNSEWLSPANGLPEL